MITTKSSELLRQGWDWFDYRGGRVGGAVEGGGGGGGRKAPDCPWEQAKRSGSTTTTKRWVSKRKNDAMMKRAH